MRKFGVVVLFLLLVVSALWFGGRSWLARSVAPHEGRIDTAVAAPVEITFDARGIPQIWARTDGDAYYAIGWMHASERLFQMELLRRLTRGELSEVFGDAAYETDAAQRRIGFARRAKEATASLSPAARTALQRYTDGVNGRIDDARLLPPEFVVLQLKPRHWTIEDCLAVFLYQTWFSHELMDADRRYQRVLDAAGEAGAQLVHAAHPWSPPTVPDAFADAVLGASRMRMSTASNSWAVAPAKSQSGAAIHASDPHLAIHQVPGLWYLAGLHSDEGLDVVGATSAGMPFVVMGHNAAIAYSFTVASVDLIDYFDDTGAAALRTFRETIVVKGEDRPRILEVKETARGVLVDATTSMHWAGFDFALGRGVDAGLALQKASTFDAFRGAVTSFGALDANWVYSDRSGNVGYQLGAPIPVRTYDSYRRQKASDASAVWRGYVPLEETPHALNPSSGFVASCNNQIVSARWPYPLPGFYDPWRITRAHALLSQPGRFTPDDMARFQLDLGSGIAARWKDLAGLSSWDGRMNADSRDATVFAAWWNVLPRLMFEDDLGAEWKAARGLVDAALTSRSPLIDDRRSPAVETREDLAARALVEAKRIAAGRTWGEASTLSVTHPLSSVEILDRWLRLNRGPLPAPGDPGTLNANFYAFDEKSGQFRSQIGASMRFVLDWSDPDSFTLTGALGQSGNPFSPHYDDFLAMQRRGEKWTVPFTRRAVFAKATSVLRLE